MGDELVHYGIKGMRWGVRRTEVQLARARGQRVASATKATDTKKKSTSAKRKISDMSDEELDRAVRRLQLEKRYRELNPEKVSAGKRFTSAVMKNVVVPAANEAGKQLLKDAIVKAAQQVATSATKKKT